MTRPASADQLMADVERSFSASPDRRLQEVMTAAVRHLHAFVAEVGPSRDEWRMGIDFLTAVGHLCTETRQEFILLSDVLGVSSLVEVLDFGGAEGATENTVLGPFYVPGSPLRRYGDSILEGPDGGQRLVVRGRVTGPAGRPLAGATVDVWQNASNRLYAVQDPDQHPHNLRGRFLTGEDGSFEFRAIRPVPYPIPDDGPVGRLLKATGRHPWRAAHVHLLVSAPGHRTLTTHVFDAESDYLDSDAVFGVRDSLIVRFTTDAETGEALARFDVALQRVPEAG
jgi:protocatechuate 3,4-dioxygenase beta subunit